jgi:hypothetical protein
MIINEPPLWNKAASEILNQFLSGTTGQLFLAHLAVSRPALLRGVGDINLVALRAQDTAGYEACIARVLSLAEPPVEEKSSDVPDNYPPLDDDSQWTQKAT